MSERLAGSVSGIAGHWDVVVAGARIAGASAAWALAPYTGRVLLVDSGQQSAFWPQQSTWDRRGNLVWADLGLLDTVLACGAPPTYGHAFRTGEEVVEHEYPQDDAYGFRMSLPREVLDPALVRAAQTRGNVTIVRPGRVRDIVTEDGRVSGATVRVGDVDHAVTCELLVLADGRRSRNAAALGAAPYRVVASPWIAMLAYFADLPLPADRGYFSLRQASITICTPCGDRLWCISTDVHRRYFELTGQTPVPEFERLIALDPLLGPAVASGRRTTPIGGAGKLRMYRRPMSGPGWCLVGDAGYHLDPVTAGGTRAALESVRVLRDRVIDTGKVDGMALSGLAEVRDAVLEPDWVEAEQICAA